ncbi:MAE_28990/MAE_18760 family HEPN-like nuclease [Burkholderia cepacia]|uniref:MAE_28990/MAE_18760 family HEPN-like nuclease n=1 Tax=Burkholderia cepacia TaxID=292 RepID=UPI0022351788|nr:MAE_28990/MAE_18760 family HEPN-like nuclease [Burkholderia cepacia]
MDYESFVTQLEQDREWREREMRTLLNDLAGRESEEARDEFRRPLVALQYAHYEGFTKFALQHYVNAVNTKALKCSEVTHELVALSFAKVFRELRNPDPKGRLFKGALPTDTPLHKFAREVHFLTEMDDVFGKLLVINDDAIDTESNLTPAVLRKNLFRLGLSMDFVDGIDADLNRLVGIRNEITHGDSKMKRGVTVDDYGKFSGACKKAMDNVDSQVRDAYRSNRYLKSSLAA